MANESKLDDLTPGGGFRITQGTHGAYQGNEAIDWTNRNTSEKRLLAGADNVKVSQTYGSGTGRYFNVYGKDWMLQHVHSRSYKAGYANAKNVIGESVWHHFHTAIKVLGKWRVFLDYCRRDKPIIGSSAMQKYPRWLRWSTYADRSLPHAKTNNGNINKMGYKINDYQYKLSSGGWRSEVIQELIAAGVWAGTWQENQSKFNRLNPTAPNGGWKPGNIVNFADKPMPIQNNNQVSELEKKVAELEQAKKELMDSKAASIAEKQDIIDDLEMQIVTLKNEQQREIEEVQNTGFETVIDVDQFKITSDFETYENNRFKFTKENFQKVGKGALIAGTGSILVYLLNLLEIYDFGEIEALFVFIIPTLINALREWAKVE